jgi:hypothetical protein
MNTRTSLITATSLTATFVALCAAIFSVTGIAKLFAGAALSAGIMASALELGKIVSISFLYQYWKEIPKTLKYYLSTAAVILMIITSAGIYGYLSSAYAKVAATPLTLSADIQTNQNRVTSIDQDIKRKEDRLNQLITLRSQQETRLDQLVSKSTSGNSSSIRTAQNALNAADKNVTSLQNEITNLSAKRDSLNGLNISKRVEIETNGDIGTFVYIAKILGTDLDTVVKWFTLVIVLVFDPLAVALVITVNFLIKNKINDDVLLSPPQEKPEPVKEVDEPYKVYDTSTIDTELVEEVELESTSIDEELTTEVPVSTTDNSYLQSTFNWKDRSLWEGNPDAVRYYDRYLKHKLEG